MSSKPRILPASRRRQPIGGSQWRSYVELRFAAGFGAIALSLATVSAQDGRVVTDGKRVVSKDGRTMTLAQTGVNQQGQKVHTIAFYEKQGGPGQTQ